MILRYRFYRLLEPLFKLCSWLRLRAEKRSWESATPENDAAKRIRARNAIAAGKIFVSNRYSEAVFNAFPSAVFSINRRVRWPSKYPKSDHNYVRLAADLDGWLVENKNSGATLTGDAILEFLREKSLSQSIGPAKDAAKLSVIVPVWNNGTYLLGKCLPSLQLNDAWAGKMEVLIVDDGSDDEVTLGVLQFLEEFDARIKVEHLECRSGSASRPRNIGLENSEAEFVTFLDPDNAISPGGYDKMLKIATANSSVDVVSGYQLKIGTRYGETARNSYGPFDIKIDDTRRVFFERGSFPTVSTQAAVIRREFLRECNIRFADGAIGQDTIFGWEVALRARAVIFTAKAWVLYFCERRGSITNRPSSENYKKRVLKDLAVYGFLTRFDLWEPYTRG